MKNNPTQVPLRSLFTLVAVLGAGIIPPLHALAKPAPADKPQAKPYTISRGDTLSNIAESLYGNWAKFKDLWKLNQDRISNPDLIFPGQRLRLIDGTELELFGDETLSDSIQKSTPLADAPLLAARDGYTGIGNVATGQHRTLFGNNKGQIHRASRKARSLEWQLLPKQSWEQFTFQTPPQVDPSGFDRRSKVGIQYKDSIQKTVEVTPDRLAVLGEITAGRTDYSRFGLGEQVIIRADEELQVGKIYSVTREPQKISSDRDGRTGFVYRLAGKIKIVGVRDQAFVGTIISAVEPIEREFLLVDEVMPARIAKAIPAPNALAASLVEDESAYSFNIAPLRMVFLDVGSEDGVRPGMIFRRYQHDDPYTGKKISSQDFLVDAEVEIISVNPKFSAAMVLDGRTPLHRKDQLVALTDIRDLERHLGLQGALHERTSGNLDELDQMDPAQGIGEQEDRDLQQLENEATGDADDIQLIETNSNSRGAVKIGDETGPNDRSGAPAAPANTAPPADSALDTPEASEPSEPNEVTPEETPAPPPTVEEPSEPAPVEESTQSTPESAPEALPSETLPKDPFSTESFQDAEGNDVEPAPVSEQNPNPTSDPILEALPAPTQKRK